MRKISLFAALFALSILFAAPAASAQAEAESKFVGSVDLHPIIPFESGFGLGFGIDLRGGYPLQLDGFTLAPEGVLGWNSFGVDGPVSVSLLRFAAGARASFELDGGMTPSAFARLGYGSLRSSFMGFSASEGSGLLELGGALDFPVADQITVGGHLGFHHLFAGNGFSYLSLGAQLNFQF